MNKSKKRLVKANNDYIDLDARMPLNDFVEYVHDFGPEDNLIIFEYSSQEDYDNQTNANYAELWGRDAIDYVTWATENGAVEIPFANMRSIDVIIHE